MTKKKIKLKITLFATVSQTYDIERPITPEIIKQVIERFEDEPVGAISDGAIHYKYGSHHVGVYGGVFDNPNNQKKNQKSKDKIMPKETFYKTLKLFLDCYESYRKCLKLNPKKATDKTLNTYDDFYEKVHDNRDIRGAS